MTAPADQPTEAPDAAGRIGEIRTRLAAATPGPWTAEHRHTGLTADNDEVSGLGLEIDGPPECWNRGQFARGADAQFIAHSREDVPWLLAEIERLATSRNTFRYLSGRHLDRLRELEEVGKEHADCPTHLAVLTAALQAAERREAGLREIIGVAIAGLEHTAAGDLSEVRYAIALLTDACHDLAAPDRADQEGTK